MAKKLENYPVLFRMAREGGERYLTALLPYGLTSRGTLQCYAHVGQHGEASLDWYHTTKRATPEEYADLLTELRSIYEAEPDAVRLVVKQRLPRNWREHAWKNS